MKSLLYKAVERMLREKGSFSRNKHFEAFNDPGLRNATRIVRHLSALESDLLHNDPHRISLTREETPSADGLYRFCLRIHLEAPGGRRTAYLTADEVRILSLNPQVQTVLAEVNGGKHPLDELPPTHEDVS